jgi:hypothetical protein
MKNSLTSILKGALLATTAAAAVSSAQAQTPNPVPLAGAYQQGNLLAGFTTGSGNDLIVNLGSLSSVLVNGNVWNLTAALSLNGISFPSFTSASWGVIGVSTTGSKTYSTAAVGNTPNNINNIGNFNSVKSAAGDLGSDLNGTTGLGNPAAANAGNGSWNNGTLIGTDSLSWGANAGNPNDLVTTDLSPGNRMSEDFYFSPIGASATQTQLSQFSLGIYNGNVLLSYGLSEVPEPSTNALFLCSAGGLFLMTVRRKLSRKA